MTGPANPQVTDEMIYAGAQALRERDMAGRITVPWDKIPNGQKKKWQERSLACLTAALADHVVVPRTASPEIIDAIEKSLSQEVLSDYRYLMPDNGAELLYRAMISAAPIPQKEG